MDNETHRNNSYILATLSLVVFLGTQGKSKSLGIIVPYISVFIFTLSVCRLIYIQFEKYKIPLKTASWVISFIALGLFANIDTYQEQWKNDTTTYVDTKKRWSGEITYRQISAPDYVSYGAIKNTNNKIKLHGEWAYITDQKTTYEYFWYHEKITEGEWHLRNK